MIVLEKNIPLVFQSGIKNAGSALGAGEYLNEIIKKLSGQKSFKGNPNYR